MADGDFTPHVKAADEIGRAGINLATATFRMMLLNGWTPNPDTDDDWADINANEIALTGYTANGQVLSNVSFTRDNGNDRSAWDFDPVTWNGLAAGTVSRAAIVLWTGTAATSIVIGNIHLVTQPNGGNYTVEPPAAGALHVRTVAGV